MVSLTDREFGSLKSVAKTKLNDDEGEQEIKEAPVTMPRKKKPKIKGFYVHNTNNPKNGNSTKIKEDPEEDQYELVPSNSAKRDEFEDDLIKIETPAKNEAYIPAPPAIEESRAETGWSSSRERTPANDYDDGIAINMSDGNVLQALKTHKRSKIDAIKEKYKNHHFPEPMVSKKALLARCEKHLGVISKILKGKEDVSQYYKMAKQQQQASSHETMSSNEKWEINWEQYYGGYYGFKRQSIIGNMINARCQKDLRQAAKKNRTVSYWTTSAFSTYVLANEVLIRFAMEDFGCEFEEAQKIIHESAEYGTIVGDSVEVVDDIDIGEEAESGQPEREQEPKRTVNLLDSLVNGF